MISRVAHGSLALTFALIVVVPVRATPSSLPAEVGYNAGEQETARSAALGGAVRAIGSSVDGLYVNPAGMATTRVYHLMGGVQIWPQARRQTYGGAAVDSVVNRQRIAGGIAANWTTQDQDALDRGSFDFRFGMAVPLSDKLFAGATFKYLSLTEGGAPANVGLQPSLASGGLSGNPIVSQITFDAGLTARLTDQVWLGAVGTNLTDPGNRFLPLTFGGGLGYGTDQFSLELDAVSDFSTYDQTRWKMMGGGELLLADSFPVRAGYRYDEGLGSHSISGGLGYVAPEFALEGGVRGVVVGQRSLTVVIALRYHLDSGGGFAVGSEDQ
ncbi:MAG TPA: hypothetical protein VHM70_22695 [Polyangiaceae bacterium]|jgi:hypothetical protein|nr:hypothetical protein [Polyangiaceae bacterium]